MADPLTTVIVALALISTSTSLAVTISKFIAGVRNAPKKYRRLWTEVLVLREIVDECHQILDRVKVPKHVWESLISCFEMGQEVEDLLHKAQGHIDPDRQRIMVAIRLVLRGDELTKAATIFRERVVLLRDICSE